MVILSRTFDFTKWIVQVTANFPKNQRFVITKRLQDATLDFYESIIQANQGMRSKRFSQLKTADSYLEIARHYIRLSHQMGWLSDGQYLHGSKAVAEIGRLLGGWIKQSAS